MGVPGLREGGGWAIGGLRPPLSSPSFPPGSLHVPAPQPTHGIGAHAARVNSVQTEPHLGSRKKRGECVGGPHLSAATHITTSRRVAMPLPLDFPSRLPATFQPMPPYACKHMHACRGASCAGVCMMKCMSVCVCV